jgi:hypothetical protein
MKLYALHPDREMLLHRANVLNKSSKSYRSLESIRAVVSKLLRQMANADSGSMVNMSLVTSPNRSWFR